MNDIVGTRGLLSLKPTIPFMDDYLKCFIDPCEPNKNRKGYIGLCVAENKLVQDMLSKRLQQMDIMKSAFDHPDMFCYNDFLGLYSIREKVAEFLTKRFLRNGTMNQILPEHVVLGSGCCSLLNLLCFVLAEEGDAVLIPAPYYAAFESDMLYFAKCVPFPVKQSNPVRGPTKEELDEAIKEAEKQGLTVKMLLLTNPNNPLGTIYESKVIYDAITWARNKKMHTIVDEIYALSTHNKENKFESILQILNNEMKHDVHMMWGLSKDFGCSGLRIGILSTQNELLLKALGSLNTFSGVPNPMQGLLANILSDDLFVDTFLKESSIRLRKSYQLCTSTLNELKIPYLPAEAGMFVYCDFSNLFPDKHSSSFEWEDRFFHLMANTARIILTPGKCQRELKGGSFRLCYAWISYEILEIAMQRIKFVVEYIRANGWDNVSSLTIDDM